VRVPQRGQVIVAFVTKPGMEEVIKIRRLSFVRKTSMCCCDLAKAYSPRPAAIRPTQTGQPSVEITVGGSGGKDAAVRALAYGTGASSQSAARYLKSLKGAV
jgi:hypothetical protein